VLLTAVAARHRKGLAQSASLPVISSVQTPALQNQPPPSQVTQVTLEPWSPEMIGAVQQINALPARRDLSTAQQSEIIGDCVTLINAIRRTPALKKQEKSALIRLTGGVTLSLVSEDTLAGQQKTDLVKLATTTIARVAGNSILDSDEKLIIAHFVANVILEVTFDPNIVGAEITGIVAIVLQHVIRLEQLAAT
jgi:hypothetical protein